MSGSVQCRGVGELRGCMWEWLCGSVCGSEGCGGACGSGGVGMYVGVVVWGCMWE